MSTARRRYRRAGATAEERLVWNGDSYLGIAPHGGHLESNTDQQALRFAELVADDGSAWVFRGEAGEQTATETWYMKSTEITPGGQFELLERIWDEEFYITVGFHGWKHDGLCIGGQHSPEFKAIVAETLGQVLPADIGIEIATQPSEYAGMHEQNVLNRLSESASIQLEQSQYIRENYWAEIAETMAYIFSTSW